MFKQDDEFTRCNTVMGWNCGGLCDNVLWGDWCGWFCCAERLKLLFKQDDEFIAVIGWSSGGIDGGNGGGGIDGGELVDKDDVDEWEDEELLVFDLVDNLPRLNWLYNDEIAWFWLILAKLFRVEIADDVAKGADNWFDVDLLLVFTYLLVGTSYTFIEINQCVI